jgi:hypothetical protein
MPFTNLTELNRIENERSRSSGTAGARRGRQQTPKYSSAVASIGRHAAEAAANHQRDLNWSAAASATGNNENTAPNRNNNNNSNDFSSPSRIRNIHNAVYGSLPTEFNSPNLTRAVYGQQEGSNAIRNEEELRRNQLFKVSAIIEHLPSFLLLPFLPSFNISFLQSFIPSVLPCFNPSLFSLIFLTFNLALSRLSFSS